jgi:hypothetical protein
MATRIYCPKCEWEPTPRDSWVCTPGCGYAWNTFETRGKCPGCSKQWAYTQCLACWVKSPHEDWYHDDEVDRLLESLSRERVREEELVET